MTTRSCEEGGGGRVPPGGFGVENVTHEEHEMLPGATTVLVASDEFNDLKTAQWELIFGTKKRKKQTENRQKRATLHIFRGSSPIPSKFHSTSWCYMVYTSTVLSARPDERVSKVKYEYNGETHQRRATKASKATEMGQCSG
ncbi:hypothetical protein KQX54_002289 [Cotesia glomerata]|uniref:Uncharacterized protein n=1 Tax=Cotesia glomerata TaxID=32391 RepID=A0AAV7J5J6_COTGL|nr:hypothetical protein KQX54_002289 [Cotesia glomerata]